MNPVDVFCLAFLLYHALMGLVRGFLQQLIRIAAWVAALYLTRRHSETFGARLLEVHPDLGALGARWVAWFAILFGVLVAGFLILQIAKSLLERLRLTGLDRVAGCAFGTAKAACIVVLLMVFLLALARYFDAEDRLAGSKAALWSGVVLERSGFALPDEVVADYVEWAKERTASAVAPPLAPLETEIK